MTIRVDEVRPSGVWEITHQYELDHAGRLSSGIRAGGQTTRRALCPMRKPRPALTPRTTAASPPMNIGRVARGAPHDNILTTRYPICSHPFAGSFGVLISFEQGLKYLNLLEPEKRYSSSLAAA